MKSFSPFPGLQIVYSHRADTSFRDREAIKQALTTYSQNPLAHLKLEHGIQIVPVDSAIDDIIFGDGAMTNQKNQTLSLVVGDCYPVILFDQQTHSFAILHCGWKSLHGEIIALTLEAMHNMYQTNPNDVHVWIGPGICSQHYTQVEKPEQHESKSWQSCIELNEYKNYSINLVKFIKQELELNNVPTQHIIDENICTYEQKDAFFSHRRATKEQDEDGRFFVAVWQN